FSFFLVVSALLLTALFFRLGVEQRSREIGLLEAIGFPGARIRRMFLQEGIILATAGGIVGILGAVVYGWLMMFGLRTWWVDAVGTTLLTLHVSVASLGFGFAGGIITAVGCIVVTLRGLKALSPRSLLAGSLEKKGRRGEREKGRKEAQPAEPALPLSPSPALPFSPSPLLLLLAVAFAILGVLLLSLAATKVI